jgi:carbon storage regulator
MLILTRKVSEVIVLDAAIKITVVDIQGNQVRIGVDAPGDVKVYREELYKRIQSDGQNQKDVA